MRKSISILALLAGLAAPAAAEFKALWPVDGSFSLVNGSSPKRTAEENIKSSGGELELRFDPILGWTDSRWLLLPSLALDWQSSNSILKVQDERFEFLQTGSSRLELGAAFKRTPEQRFGIRAFGETFQAKQAANEEITTGAYNYQDGGLSLDWRQKWDTGTPFRSTLGLTATDRQYPNWQSLDPSQKREKDQSIVKVYSDLEWAWNGMDATTQLGVAIQSVQYREGFVIDNEGTTAAGIKRTESVLDLSAAMPMQFGPHGVDLAVALQTWDSNLSTYDSQTGTYLADYNDFVMLRADAGYSYEFAPWGWFDSPVLALDLGLELRQYIKRPARKSDGTLSEQMQRDFLRDVTLSFNSAFSEHWGGFFKINLQNSASNNEDQSSALYNYSFNTTVLGVNFVY